LTLILRHGSLKNNDIKPLHQDSVMTRFKSELLCVFIALFIVFSLTGCGEKEKTKRELVVGNWSQERSRAFILLVLAQNGNWFSSVRIADVTSKIVKSKGHAKGTWHVEEEQLIFTVIESDIEEVWEQNDTSFFEIVEVGKRFMMLKDENDRVGEWKKNNSAEPGVQEENETIFIPMEPIAVNLNKNRSSTQDRYLCLNMNLVLKELMPGQAIPAIHPETREALILFLSSLVYEEVKDFDHMKIQRAKMIDVVNPYMEGAIEDIEIDHVIVSTTIETVEEFIIEHTIGLSEETEEGNGEKKAGDRSQAGKEEKN
jgi:hypothetical protein